MRKQTTFNLIVFSFVLLLQPGFNTIQQYQLYPTRFGIRQPPIPIPTSAVIPSAKTSLRPTNLSAKAAIVIDQTSGSILFSTSPDFQFFPASLTKLMTAMIALETFPLDKVITINDESTAVGSSMKLQKGERITVQNLLKGLLIDSGNDAAFALANNYPTGYNGFVQKMNETAFTLHMDHTTYKNVSGVEQAGHLTTARDMATLTKEAMKQSFIRETVKTQTLTVSDVDGQFAHNLASTNQLLGKIEGIEGVKTGWTDDAGQCLITQTTRNGHTMITVILGSNDRFGETERLINWSFANHSWKNYRFEDWLDSAAGDTATAGT